MLVGLESKIVEVWIRGLFVAESRCKFVWRPMSRLEIHENNTDVVTHLKKTESNQESISSAVYCIVLYCIVG